LDVIYFITSSADSFSDWWKHWKV